MSARYTAVEIARALGQKHDPTPEQRAIIVPRPHPTLVTRRVLVMERLSGFRFDDVPKTFDAQLLAALSHYGVMVADEHFGSASRVVVVERTFSTRRPESENDLTPFAGCLTLATAARW